VPLFSRVFARLSNSDLRGKILGMGIGLIAFNVLAWAWAFIAFRDHPLLLGTALLAYSFGLRHAVDPDHIAAIDNVTRKLMHEGKRPVSVGLFFSLGHSSVVVLLSVALAATATVVQDRFDDFRAVGGIIGTSISAFFLFAIAGANILILAGIWRSFRAVKRGEKLIEDDLDILLASRGLMARIFRRLFRLIEHSWHMYPLGFLFGLGFDTATEVGLLGVSAASASQGLSLWSILVFPALFSAGMALVDTADGILMLGAYGWAFVKPIRKLYYNLTITFVSVLAALLVGGVEVLGLLIDRLKLAGPFWDAIGLINDQFGLLGYGIIGIFTGGWLVSLVIYRVKGYDAIEVVT
jgi:nickel/cobalt transporter (NiCoT) family protein